MISQQELSQDLTRRGFPTSLRKLTDWRHKGLLPPLATRGSGKGKGRTYGWQSADVLVQALFVAEAFDHHVTAERTTLLLAFAGFKTDPKKVRRIWVMQLGQLLRQADKPPEFNERTDDGFWDSAVQLARKLDLPPGVDRNSMERLVNEGLKTVCAAEAFDHGRNELATIAGILGSWLSVVCKEKKIAEAITLNGLKVDRWLALLRLQFSFAEMRELLTSRPIGEFRNAVAHFDSLVENIEHLFTMHLDEADKTEAALVVRSLFRGIFGPILLTLFLRLIAEGHEKRLQKSGQLITEFVNQSIRIGFADAPDDAAKSELLSQVMPDIGPRISAIWAKFNLFRLYHIREGA